MPMDMWEDMVGQFCACGNHATHWYGGISLCCGCHGGEVITEEEAACAHKLLKEAFDGPSED